MRTRQIEKAFQINSIEKEISECDAMTFRMKGVAALILFADYFAASSGDWLVISLSLLALCIFFFVDLRFLKKKKEWELKLREAKDRLSEDELSDILNNSPENESTEKVETQPDAEPQSLVSPTEDRKAKIKTFIINYPIVYYAIIAVAMIARLLGML